MLNEEPDETSPRAGTIDVEGDAMVAKRGGGLRHDGDRSAVINVGDVEPTLGKQLLDIAVA
jgi:hypothetical protein